MLRTKQAARCSTSVNIGNTLFFKDLTVHEGQKSKLFVEYTPAKPYTQVAETYIENNSFNLMLTKEYYTYYDLISTEFVDGHPCREYNMMRYLPKAA